MPTSSSSTSIANVLIQTSWDTVKQIPNYEIVAGNILFKKIFDIAPGSHQIFSFGKEYDIPTDEMYLNPKMLNHFHLLFNTIDAAITLMNTGKLNELVTVLIGLGRRHAKYGVVDAHYPVVGEALIYTLQTALGDAFTEEVREEWIKLYALITEKMLQGSADVQPAQ